MEQITGFKRCILARQALLTLPSCSLRRESTCPIVVQTCRISVGFLSLPHHLHDLKAPLSLEFRRSATDTAFLARRLETGMGALLLRCTLME